MNFSPYLNSRTDWEARPHYRPGMGTEPSETHYGKLKLGIILAPQGETIAPGVLNFAAFVAGFPRAEKVALTTGKRSLGRRKVLLELLSCQRTMAVDTSRLFGKAKEFRWCGPGQDEFPRNGLILHWLAKQVREKVQAPYGKHERFLILWVSLPPLPQGMTLEDLNLTASLYSIGRIAENYADFAAIHRNGRLDFLKFRAGHCFPEGSYKV